MCVQGMALLICIIIRVILDNKGEREREREGEKFIQNTFSIDNKDCVIVGEVSVVHNCQHKFVDGW